MVIHAHNSFLLIFLFILITKKILWACINIEPRSLFLIQKSFDPSKNDNFIKNKMTGGNNFEKNRGSYIMDVSFGTGE